MQVSCQGPTYSLIPRTLGCFNSAGDAQRRQTLSGRRRLTKAKRGLFGRHLAPAAPLPFSTTLPLNASSFVCLLSSLLRPAPAARRLCCPCCWQATHWLDTSARTTRRAPAPQRYLFPPPFTDASHSARNRVNCNFRAAQECMAQRYASVVTSGAT